MKKDDKALMRVITPYISWTLENGLAFISLGDERKRLEKEQYVHEQHLAENKRQNLVKKACLFIVTGIMPYIDRIMNEVHKLTAHNYIQNEEIKESKYRYIDELITWSESVVSSRKSYALLPVHQKGNSTQNSLYSNSVSPAAS